MWFSLSTFTAPVPALTVVPPPIEAWVVWRVQFRLTAAAMPTPPLLSPDSLFELLLAESVLLLALGRLSLLPPPLLSVFPFVFGSFLTWSPDCWSELLPLSS
jgi:hypothetical protein